MEKRKLTQIMIGKKDNLQIFTFHMDIFVFTCKYQGI